MIPSPARVIIILLSLLLTSCASQRAITTAEEYYTLGMAYFEMGKFQEAEMWLIRAQETDKTKNASEYNLGRIAYELGRYEEAAEKFQGILKQDPQNTMALKAAAYTAVKLKDIDGALETYEKILALTPESADDGYNYALLLFALEKPAEAEETLMKYSITLEDQQDSLLLLARVQAAQDKIEAADAYHKWLEKGEDLRVQYEYAALLEKGEFYARALEEFRKIETTLTDQAPEQKKQGDPALERVKFDIARTIIIADPENPEGLTLLEGAVTGGFKDTEALDALAEDDRLTAAQVDEVRRIRDTLGRTLDASGAEEEATEEGAAEGTGETESQTDSAETEGTGENGEGTGQTGENAGENGQTGGSETDV